MEWTVELFWFHLDSLRAVPFKMSASVRTMTMLYMHIVNYWLSACPGQVKIVVDRYNLSILFHMKVWIFQWFPSLYILYRFCCCGSFRAVAFKRICEERQFFSHPRIQTHFIRMDPSRNYTLDPLRPLKKMATACILLNGLALWLSYPHLLIKSVNHRVFVKEGNHFVELYGDPKQYFMANGV